MNRPGESSNRQQGANWKWGAARRDHFEPGPCGLGCFHAAVASYFVYIPVRDQSTPTSSQPGCRAPLLDACGRLCLAGDPLDGTLQRGWWVDIREAETPTKLWPRHGGGVLRGNKAAWPGRDLALCRARWRSRPMSGTPEMSMRCQPSHVTSGDIRIDAWDFGSGGRAGESDRRVSRRPITPASSRNQDLGC